MKRDDERRSPTAELNDVEARVTRAAAGRWRQLEGEGLEAYVLRADGGREIAHLYAATGVAEAVTRAAADASQLAAALRKERAETEDLRSRLSRLESRAEGAPARGREATREVEEEAAVALAAPFHVGPKAVHAAKDDPLLALAVQVARAMQPEAKEIERARLLAMAFAASRRDMEGFWAARRQRATKKGGARGKS